MMTYQNKLYFPMPRAMSAPLLRQEKWTKNISRFPSRMELRTIVLYLQMKGINGSGVFDDLVTTLHEDARAYSTVILWPGQERLPRFSEPSHKLAEDVQLALKCGFSGLILQEQFASMRLSFPLHLFLWLSFGIGLRADFRFFLSRAK
jgi:hypothetical protein